MCKLKLQSWTMSITDNFNAFREGIPMKTVDRIWIVYRQPIEMFFMLFKKISYTFQNLYFFLMPQQQLLCAHAFNKYQLWMCVSLPASLEIYICARYINTQHIHPNGMWLLDLMQKTRFFKNSQTLIKLLEIEFPTNLIRCPINTL